MNSLLAYLGQIWIRLRIMVYSITHRLFGRDMTGVFETFYRDVKDIPWDIEGPQPVVIEAAKEGTIRGKVIDVGAGCGDNGIALAARGLKVVALDLSDTAVEQARARAKKAGPPATDNITFKQANLQDPVSLRTALGHEQYDTVLDSALFHCFTDSQQEVYASNIGAYVRPGGQLVMFVFNDKNPTRLIGPRLISRARISQVFNESKGWRVKSFDDVPYNTRASSFMKGVPATAVKAVITKT